MRFLRRGGLLLCLAGLSGWHGSIAQANDAVQASQADFADYAAIGPRVNTSFLDGVAITEGEIRPRRRHENDMDFSKYNPFYWEGRLARFKLEDFTPLGENKLRFTLITEWPQDFIPNRGPDLSAIYKGDPVAGSEVMRSKFDINMRMNHIRDFRVFEAVLGPEVFRVHPDLLKPGQLLTFEFRFFMNENFELWQKQKASNPHGISAYYSEFIRIKIGEPGLLIDSLDGPNAMPSPLRLSGGWTTIPTVRAEPWKALQQQALNILPEHAQAFMDGRSFFHTDFVDGRHIQDDSDDKPTTFFEEMRLARSGFASEAYNVRSCSSCHINNGGSLRPQDGLPNDHTIVKTFDRSTGADHASFGQQLQTSGPALEGRLKVERREIFPVTLQDGTQVFLKKPIYKVESDLAQNNLGLSPRRPQAMIGIGLLAAIPESSIRAFAAQSGGEFQEIQGKIGRFGWKADKSTVIDQIAAALRNDMGVLSSKQTSLDCGNSCRPGKDLLPDRALQDMEAYLSLLGVPPRMRPTHPDVLRGEKIFDQLNCGSCHVKSMKTGDSPFPELAFQSIQPFTDLLLHDMGPLLADDHPSPMARKWRTAPLWGLKNAKHASLSHRDIFAPGNVNILWTDAQRVADGNPLQLLHDGRAESLAEAILWHGGEATDSVLAYKALTAAERLDLESFLWDL